MKLNKILMALSAMAIVGCSSEDFNDPSVAQAIDDSRLVQLPENFVLAGVGVEGSTTRTHWEQDAETGAFVNKFLPIYGSSSTNLEVAADLEAQAVGLCWLGQGAVGTDVYTNYQFHHFGWLKKGETEADVDNCVPAKLYNGALYDEITLSTASTVGDEADVTKFSITTTTPVDKTSWNASTDLNYNSGVYKTENKSIFGGQYIVYYPYNKDFKDAGTIPAVAKTNWEAPVDAGTVKGWMAPEIGKETFRYSAPVTIEGGNKAANFGLYNLSAIVQLRLATAAGELTSASIDQIVLYSASEKLLKKAYLAADKIAAGATGADLYASTEGTKTIVATPTTAISFNAQGKPSTSAYITVLPTTVDDLVAFVHNSADGKWAQISLGNTEFKAGWAKRLDIVVKAADFTSDYIAVDEASLTASLGAARTAAGPSAPYIPQTITVIGDITLATTSYNINNAKDVAITIKGDDIIVPEDVTLTLATNMESEVRVLGKSCCAGAAGGRLVVAGGTISDVTMEPTEARVTAATYDNLNPQITFSAAAEIAADKKFDVQAGNVIVDAAVQQHKGNINIVKDAKLTVNATGSLSFLGSTVDNYGTIEVKKAGQFYMKNANGSSVWTDGQTMTNHETGKFIHNVDAVVGTAVQFMKQNGEYRCRVDKQKALDDAYTQWTACNVIEMVDATTDKYDLAKACQHKHKGDLKYIDIEVNNPTTATEFEDPSTGNSDGLNIQIGNLTVVEGSKPLTINYPKIGNKQRQLTVNGNMTASEDTNLTESDKITVTGNLDIDNGATLTYAGSKKIVNGLKVTGDITVTDATFNASANDAIKIECKNFSLIKKDPAGAGASAEFGNRESGNTDKSMEVKGTISNGKGCTFTIDPAVGANLLAWITCYKVEGEGTYAGTPTVIAPPAE